MSEGDRGADLQPEDLQRVAAIFFCAGRSGSLFLQSLLDNHPRVLMTPGTYLVGFYEFWHVCGGMAPDALLEAFGDYFECLFDVSSPKTILGAGANPGLGLGFDRMGEARDERLGVDRRRFLEELRRLLAGRAPIGRRLFFQAVHLAYARALGRRLGAPGEPHLIVYQLHTPSVERVSLMMEDFPDATLLNTVRHPIQSFGSHVKATRRQGTLRGPSSLTWLLEQALRGGRPVLEACRGRTHAVRLEDLKTRPRPTLEAVAGLLGLAWDDRLLESSFDGLKWWNVKDSDPIHGFDPLTIQRTHDELFDRFDRLRLEVLLGPKYRAWDYGPSAGCDDAALMRTQLERPFQFEAYAFPDATPALRRAVREAVRGFVLDYWDEVSAGRLPEGEIMPLVRPLAA